MILKSEYFSFAKLKSDALINPIQKFMQEISKLQLCICNYPAILKWNIL